MHPDTIAALDAWMPIDEVAARWIRHYADSRRQTKKSSPTARLIIARDTSQPVGLAEVDGSFRYSPPSDMAAEAVADMAGPMQANPAGGHTQMNPPPPRNSPGRGAHTPRAGGADDTVVMDRTERWRGRLIPGRRPMTGRTSYCRPLCRIGLVMRLSAPCAAASAMIP